MIGSSQAKVAKTDLAYRVLGSCNSRRSDDAFLRKSRVCFDRAGTRLRRSGIGLTLRAVRAEQGRHEEVAGHSSSASPSSRSRPVSFALPLLPFVHLFLLVSPFPCLKCWIILHKIRNPGRKLFGVENFPGDLFVMLPFPG